jgi:hypothetical protein
MLVKIFTAVALKRVKIGVAMKIQMKETLFSESFLSSY